MPSGGKSEKEIHPREKNDRLALRFPAVFVLQLGRRKRGNILKKRRESRRARVAIKEKSRKHKVTVENAYCAKWLWQMILKRSSRTYYISSSSAYSRGQGKRKIDWNPREIKTDYAHFNKFHRITAFAARSVIYPEQIRVIFPFDITISSPTAAHGVAKSKVIHASFSTTDEPISFRRRELSVVERASTIEKNKKTCWNAFVSRFRASQLFRISGRVAKISEFRPDRWAAIYRIDYAFFRKLEVLGAINLSMYGIRFDVRVETNELQAIVRRLRCA